MKTYKIYDINDKVFAISEYNSNGKGTNHFAIYPCLVDSISINDDGVSYWLKTYNGKHWGDSVTAERVNSSFDALIAYVKDIWVKHSEWDT